MTEQKIKELGDVRRGFQDTKKQGAVELGWATVHGSNRSMGTKNCVGNRWNATLRPLILRGDNSR